MHILIGMIPVVGQAVQLYEEISMRRIINDYPAQTPGRVDNTLIALSKLEQTERNARISGVFQVVLGLIVAVALQWGVLGVAGMVLGVGSSVVNHVVLRRTRAWHAKFVEEEYEQFKLGVAKALNQYEHAFQARFLGRKEKIDGLGTLCSLTKFQLKQVTERLKQMMPIGLLRKSASSSSFFISVEQTYNDLIEKIKELDAHLRPEKTAQEDGGAAEWAAYNAVKDKGFEHELIYRRRAYEAFKGFSNAMTPFIASFAEMPTSSESPHSLTSSAAPALPPSLS